MSPTRAGSLLRSRELEEARAEGRIEPAELRLVVDAARRAWS